MNGFKKLHLALLTAVAMIATVNAGQPSRQQQKRGQGTTLQRKSRMFQRGMRIEKKSPALAQVSAPMQKIRKTVSTAKQIQEQANIIVNTEEFITTDVTPRRIREVRNEARNMIRNQLMPQLEQEKKNLYKAIKGYVDTVLKFGKTEESKIAARKALKNIEIALKNIKVQAKRDAALARAANNIERAPIEQKEIVAQAETQKIEAVNKEAEKVSYWSRAQGFFVDPFVKAFDSERPALERAYHGVIGVAKIGVIAAPAYFYGPAAAAKIYSMGKAAYEMTPEQWKAAAMAAPEQVVEAAKATPGAIASAAMAAPSKGWELGARGVTAVSSGISSAWTASMTALGLYTQASNAVTAVTTVASVGAAGAGLAKELLKSDPTDSDAQQLLKNSMIVQQEGQQVIHLANQAGQAAQEGRVKDASVLTQQATEMAEKAKQDAEMLKWQLEEQQQMIRAAKKPLSKNKEAKAPMAQNEEANDEFVQGIGI